MGKAVRDTDNAYKKARVRAAEFNDKLKSREGAAEMMGVSPSSILNYETGVCKQIPPDVVVKMAEIYSSPELMNHYCCNECPIGKLTVPKIEVLGIDRVTLQVIGSLEGIGVIKSELIAITKDGVIDEDEKPKLEHVINFLEEISKQTNNLKLSVEKYLKCGECF